MRVETGTKRLWFALLMAGALPSNGQTIAASEGLTPPGMKVGPVAGSYRLSDFDSVNLFNGKASFSFPMLEIGGRGEAGYSMTIPVESTNWQVTELSGSPTSVKIVEPTWEEAPSAGLSPGYLHRKSIGVRGASCLYREPAMAATYTTYTLTRPGGGSMEFHPVDSPTGNKGPKSWSFCEAGEPDYNRGTTFETKDGSAATLVLSNPVYETAYQIYDGYKSGGEPTGSVTFKNGVRYDIIGGEVRSIVDRNGNKSRIDYYPPFTAPKSVILNVNSGVAQAFAVNLLGTVGATVLSSLSTFRVETRIHGFIPPAPGGHAVIWSTNSGSGPRLVMKDGTVAAELTEAGATAGCSVPLSGRADVVVRFQRETTGQYRLTLWDYSDGPVAAFGNGACPTGTGGDINVSGLLSIGSDAPRTASTLYKGRIAYVRLYGSTTASTAAPNENPDDAVLDYAFNDAVNGYILDHAGLQNLTAYGSPTGDASPGATGPGVGAVKTVTDPLERVTSVSPVQETSAGSNIFLQTITYKGYAASDRTIKIHSGPLSAALLSGGASTVGSLFGTIFANESQTYNPVKVNRIELPGGQEYTFKYNACGEVAEVTVPTGGKVQYDWDGIAGEASGTCKGRSAAIGGIERYLKERRAYARGGTLEQKIEYARASTPCGGDCMRDQNQLPIFNTVVSMTLKDASSAPMRIERHMYFDSPPIWRGPLTFSGWKEGREYRNEVVKTAFTNLSDMNEPPDDFQRTVQTWKQYGAGGSVAPANYEEREDRPRVTEVLTTMKDAGVQKVKSETFEYDEYNNLLDTSEKDWGNSAVLRRKMVSYLKSNYDSDLTIHLRALPLEEFVFDAGNNLAARTTYKYDENPDQLLPRSDATGRDPAITISGRTKRGNVTKATKWRSDKANADPETKQSYDELGNVVESWDARENKTTLTYADSFSTGTSPSSGKTYGFITKLTAPLPRAGAAGPFELSGTYDRFVGRLRTATDMSGITSSYEYNDPLDRASKLTRTTSETSFGYPDFYSVNSSTAQNSCGLTQAVTTTQVFDGFGRPVETKLVEGGTVTINTLTTYDGAGRAFAQYLPYRSNAAVTPPAAAKTTTSYDWLGRTATVAAADGSVRRYGYRVNETWVQDEAGKWTRSVTDGLGRLTEVQEDPRVTDNTIVAGQTNPGGDTGLITTYDYDTLGNLKQVNQGTLLPRKFTYNSLGWLTRAENPESGTVTYDYDKNGNLISRSDGRGATVTIAPDAWNRPETKTYTSGTAEATGTVTYSYDAHTSSSGTSYPKGKLTQVAVAGGAVVRYDQYDGLGRVLKTTQTTNGVDYEFVYGYNAAGGLETEQYPKSGRLVTTCYDQAGRTLAVKNGGASSVDVYGEVQTGPDAENATTVEGYSALGGIQRLAMEGGKLTRQWSYNSRGQTEVLKLYHTPAGQTAAAKMKLTLGYATGANNGNVATQQIQVGGTVVGTQSYTYDKLNRLTAAEEGTNWKQTNGYDRWGNRWVDTGNTSGLPGLTLETAIGPSWFSGGTNRVPGWTYDLAGNVEAIQGMPRSFVYDVENRQAAATVNGKRTQYSYDGEGRRVMRLECPDVAACTTATAGAKTTVMVYDAAGRMVQEYGVAAGATARSYVFDDHLGSTRMKVQGNGTVEGWWDYLPFGEEVPGSAGGRSGLSGFAYGGVRPSMMFTGKERDAETGLDYFGARYLSGAMGRWTSPDEPMLDQYPGDPQSWNLYGYVRNNPLRYTDPNGQECKDGKDEEGNPCFSVDVTDKLGVRAKRVAGAAAQGVNGFVGMANFVILALSSRTMDPNVERSRQIPYIELQDRSGNANFGAQVSQLASAPFLLTAGAIGDLLKAASKIDRNLLTKVGRALQKHAGRAGSSYGASQGSAASMNQQGLQVLESILSHPQATTTIRHHARFGEVLEVVAPGGRGARFSADGKEFIGFIE